jgi:hypothetical protein
MGLHHTGAISARPGISVSFANTTALGSRMSTELFERDMKKLRSVLKCKNAGVVEQKKGATNGSDQNMESKQGGMGQQLQDGRDMADGWQTVQRRRCRGHKSVSLEASCQIHTMAGAFSISKFPPSTSGSGHPQPPSRLHHSPPPVTSHKYLDISAVNGWEPEPQELVLERRGLEQRELRRGELMGRRDLNK